MGVASLEERVQRLEDLEAIKDLMARYSHHINKGWNGEEVDLDAMPSVFAEDIEWTSWNAGTPETGIERGTEILREETGWIDFSMHSLTNPIIAIDGDKATGNWLMWIASKRKGFTPNQIFMSLDITYARTARGWLIKTLDMHFGMMLLNL